jgi:hypothetical protein
LVDFGRAELDTCLIAKTNMGWLWHRRLAHVGMKNLHKLLKGEHILRLTNVHFEKDRICSACQAGKQVGVHHPHKNIMTTDRPLKLLHMDLFGPIAYISIGGSKYRLATENFGSTSPARGRFEILQIKLSARWLTSTHNSMTRWPTINNTTY